MHIHLDYIINLSHPVIKFYILNTVCHRIHKNIILCYLGMFRRRDIHDSGVCILIRLNEFVYNVNNTLYLALQPYAIVNSLWLVTGRYLMQKYANLGVGGYEILIFSRLFYSLSCNQNCIFLVKLFSFTFLCLTLKGWNKLTFTSL